MKKLMFCIITAFAMMVSVPMAVAMPVDSGNADTVGSYPRDGFNGNVVVVDPTEKKTQSTNNSDIFAWACCQISPGGGSSAVSMEESPLFRVERMSTNNDGKVARNGAETHEGAGYAGVTPSKRRQHWVM